MCSRLALCTKQLSKHLVRYKSNDISNVQFPLRSWLFTKHTEKGLLSAANGDSDVVVLDMEDAVSDDKKSIARQRYADAIEDGLFANKPTFVRVNGIDNMGEMQRDIDQFCLTGVHGLIVPKVENADTIRAVEDAVSKAELKHERMAETRLVPVLETGAGYIEAFSIAAASQRNFALIFGNHDFSAHCRTNTHSLVDDSLMTRALIAARACDINAIGGACTQLDSTLSDQFFRRLKSCGFDGSAALTLTQSVQANREFSPSPRELRWARQVAEQEGLHIYQESIQDIPHMIGPPHHQKAKTILMTQSVLDHHNAKCHNSPSADDAACIHGLPSSSGGLQDNVVVGATIDGQHEVTIRDGWRTAWESSFLTTNHLHTSDIFASQFGHPTSPLPTMLLKTLALSLCVSTFSESARVHLGCYNAYHHEPVYVGDTLSAKCVVTAAKNLTPRDGGAVRHTIVMSTHMLLNECQRVVFSVEKRTMFAPLRIEQLPTEMVMSAPHCLPPENDIVSKIKTNILPQSQSSKNNNNNTTRLHQGDLLFHTDHKVFGRSETLNLCRLLKITNAHHHNSV